MIKITNTSLSLVLFIGLFLSACNKEKQLKISDPFSHSGIYFGKHFPKEYQKGIIDGCSTSKGKYQKLHKLFQKSKDYENGWFLGRNRCKHLLKVEEKPF
jgi:hypothetical protein